MSNDSVQKTLLVASVLCVICSIIVAGSTVLLRPTQEENKRLDFKKNIVVSAGILKNDVDDKNLIEQAYSKIETITINLNTGEESTNIENFNLSKELQTPERFIYIQPIEDKAGIKKRAVYSPIYLMKENGEVKKYIFPIYGKGLWSTMYGFITLESDLNTVSSINFYSDGETPGLGGEINNPLWKNLWPGKKIFDQEQVPIIDVIKGHVDEKTVNSDYKVDGLSGATITSKGVSNMLKYWMGPHGMGQYIKRLKQKNGEEI